ncbi:helix-hairpin-helix domain-containing protein [Patescibacteria group bacterium]
MNDILTPKLNLFIKEKPFTVLFLVYLLAVATSVIVSTQIKDNTSKIEIFTNDGSINDKKPEENKMYSDIAGAVNSPGVYELSGDYRIGDLIALAGGISEDASEEWISKVLNLSIKVTDGQKIYIPFKWDVFDPSYDIEPLPLVKKLVGEYSASVVSKESPRKADTVLLNVNIASQEELDTLPGIGPTYAGKIYQNRPYEDFSSLLEKSGISNKILEKIKDLIEY